MDYHVGQIGGMDPPKLCCIPIRPLVCVLAILAIIERVIAFTQGASVGMGIFVLVFILLDLLLLVGAFQNNAKYLNWSLKIVLIGLGLSGLQLLIFPVIAASYGASGLYPPRNGTFMMTFVNYFVSENGTPKEMFAHGIAAGYLVETAVLLGIGFQCFKYVLVNHLFEYAKAAEGY